MALLFKGKTCVSNVKKAILDSFGQYLNFIAQEREKREQPRSITTCASRSMGELVIDEISASSFPSGRYLSDEFFHSDVQKPLTFF